MKTVLCSLVLCLASCLPVAAEELSFYLDWQSQLRSRLPHSALTNLPGENGEMMKIWAFGFRECYLVQWQFGVPVWWYLQPGTGYSSTGIHTVTTDTLFLPGFDEEQPFYLFVAVQGGTAEELLTSDTQSYSAWTMSPALQMTLPINFWFIDLPWQLTD